MKRRSLDIELTVVFEPSEQGWLTATIPTFPGVVRAPSSRADACEFVLDAVKGMLSVAPQQQAATGSAETVRLRFTAVHDPSSSSEAAVAQEN
jgi:hypothetical protein